MFRGLMRGLFWKLGAADGAGVVLVASQEPRASERSRRYRAAGVTSMLLKKMPAELSNMLLDTLDRMLEPSVPSDIARVPSPQLSAFRHELAVKHKDASTRCQNLPPSHCASRNRTLSSLVHGEVFEAKPGVCNVDLSQPIEGDKQSTSLDKACTAPILICNSDALPQPPAAESVHLQLLPRRDQLRNALQKTWSRGSRRLRTLGA